MDYYSGDADAARNEDWQQQMERDEWCAEHRLELFLRWFAWRLWHHPIGALIGWWGWRDA